jgi:preprotein translocase subunit SecE
VARQTRSQRRARREAQAHSASSARVPPRRPPGGRDGTADGGAARPSQPREIRAPGGGFFQFVRESWAELQKVEWPGQQQLIQGVVVVLIACLVVGTYLWLADLVFKRLVQNVFLGQ